MECSVTEQPPEREREREREGAYADQAGDSPTLSEQGDGRHSDLLIMMELLTRVRLGTLSSSAIIDASHTVPLCGLNVGKRRQPWCA
jgi:hypothetical protein